MPVLSKVLKVGFEARSTSLSVQWSTFVDNAEVVDSTPTQSIFIYSTTAANQAQFVLEVGYWLFDKTYKPHSMSIKG
jgi:hypothetical protein